MLKRYTQNTIPLFSALGLFVLIMDSKTAILGAAEGVQICIQTLIPSLFPFFIISGYFCKVYSQIKLPFLEPVMRLCGIPQGAESLFIIGILGGYPVGAKNIADAFIDGKIDKKTAHRMLGFCNNAGPAFVFGVVSGIFDSPIKCWLLLFILLLSAILTSCILPGKNRHKCIQMDKKVPSFTECFEGSITSTASVCGWVILFRVLITILKRWLLWIFPVRIQLILTGILELSNGCISLGEIENEGLRFILSSAFLSFGGICVYLQTKSVTKKLGTGYYFPGKLIQTSLCIIISAIVQQFAAEYSRSTLILLIAIPVVILLICFVYTYKQQKKNNCSNFNTAVV